ncbi:myosin-6 [Phtheirospermum japonicum]|uniref:Myosin-6 n=1 Tax=Phtheirospermum japonicum TaxID=374723 RepID=A0A830CFY7_9LAMI|nr:myosin-6 [Phtheirospermum japonicum]
MEYKHFSHHHPLTLHKIQPGQQSQLCHGCQLPCNNNGSIFACYSYNFFLHDHCGNANQYVKHPSHPAHPLVLIPTPTYCSGTFLCNGCGASGNAFSYCCPLYEIDFHVNCTFLPLKVTHNSHPHDLFLSFTAPINRVKPPDYCRVCRKEMSFRNWFYFCEKAGCDQTLTNLLPLHTDWIRIVDRRTNVKLFRAMYDRTFLWIMIADLPKTSVLRAWSSCHLTSPQKHFRFTNLQTQTASTIVTFDFEVY